MRKGPSLRRRLTLALLLIFAVGMTASGIVFFQETHQTTSGLRSQTLRQQARELLAGLSVVDGVPAIDLPSRWAEAYGDPASAFSYTIFDRQGRPIGRSAGLPEPLPYQEVPEGERYGPLLLAGPGNQARLAARGPDSTVVVVARIDPQREVIAETLMEENSEPLLVLAWFIGIALVLTWLLVGWTLRPLRRAAGEAAQISAGNPAARITQQGLPEEVRPLVEAVNGALDRLAAAYQAERQFTADAAHELRTPLAVLSLRLQRAQLHGATDWAAIRRDVAQLGRLVAQLLDLARKEAADRARPRNEAPVDLGRVAREAAASLLPLVEDAGRTIEVEAPDDPLLVGGRADDLRDMVLNLADNALVHGAGTIGLKLRREGGEGILEVCDEGPGVPAPLREEVFRRFRKLRTDSTGSGLGLAIVRHVARTHGGEARFADGSGPARVEVRLPLLPASPVAAIGPRAQPAPAARQRARRTASSPPGRLAPSAARQIEMP